MADHRQQRCERILLAIEREMQRIGLWEAHPPPPQAFESSFPFCFDTLELHQWIEWVFIPRTRAILDAGLPLPEKSAIRPLAAESFRRFAGDTGRLEGLIGELDELINAG